MFTIDHNKLVPDCEYKIEDWEPEALRWVNTNSLIVTKHIPSDLSKTNYEVKEYIKITFWYFDEALKGAFIVNELKDQLVNTRVAFKKNTNGTTLNIQENEYYPFGLLSLLTQTSPAIYYSYNGKEYQRILAGYYDYGARFYDPFIGRFTNIDPK